MAWTYTYTYSQVNDYSAKDALASGNSEKIILGSDIDDELSGIQTALNLKLDPGSVASTAEAQAGTDTESFMTPNSVTEWSNAGGAGHIGEIWALSDPAADALLGYDFSAGAGSMVAQISLGTGLALTATTLNWSASGIAGHDSFTDFVADEHVAHSGVTITAGAGLTGGGTIAATRTLNVGAGNGITVNANDVAITDQAATTSQPMAITSGTFDFDITALTNIEGNALAATDEFIVDDGGTNKAIAVQDMGLRVQSAQSTQNLAANDMNSIMEFNAAATITIQTNATTAIPIGSAVIIVVDHASAAVTVTAATGVTLNTVNHPGGATASDSVVAGGTAVLIKTDTNEWYLSGDITD